MICSFLNDQSQMTKINARKSILSLEQGEKPLNRQETMEFIKKYFTSRFDY